MKIILGLFIFLLFTTAFGQGRTGTYKKSDNSGEIVIKDFPRGRIRQLEFSVTASGNKYSACLGDLKGFAKFVTKNTFEYDGDYQNKNAQGCRLTFFFSGKNLTIRETDCNYFHGAACDFAGIYKFKAVSKH